MDDQRQRIDELIDEYRAALAGSLDGRSYEEIGIARTVDGSFTLRADDTIASVLAAHRARCEASRETMAPLAGHADILREQILAARTAPG